MKTFFKHSSLGAGAISYHRD